MHYDSRFPFRVRLLSEVTAFLIIFSPSLRAEGPTVPPPPAPALPVNAQTGAAAVDDAEDESLSRYLRHVTVETVEGGKTRSRDALQTAITRFEKNGTFVDLVAVVHFADAAYYADLNKRLASYDAVLYEMVGGPAVTAPAASDPSAGVDKRQWRNMAAAFLGLEDQLTGIDYSARNFVHADFDQEKLQALLGNQGEILANLLTRLASIPAPELRDGKLPGGAAMPSQEQLLNSLLSGDRESLKKMVAPLLGEAERMVKHFEGTDGTPLVAGRNAVAMDKLAELRLSNDGGAYAIFYGAGHMPDFERRLLEEGFTKGDPIWLDAWTIGDPAATGSASSPLETALGVFSKNPDLEKGIRAVGKILEALQELSGEKQP